MDTDVTPTPQPGPGSRSFAIAAVLWPAFLVAGMFEMLVFALFDPVALQDAGGVAQGWSPQAVYTVAFLVFWLLTSLSATLTVVLMKRSSHA